MPDLDREKAWNSQGSTLNQTGSDRRSRWSFLNWHGYQAAKAAHAGPIEDVPEEPHKEIESEKSSSVEEERPVTQHTMKAYVSSSDEARSIGEQIYDHRRRFSADEESLTVPRIYMGGSGEEDSSTSRATREGYQGIGHAR